MSRSTSRLVLRLGLAASVLIAGLLLLYSIVAIHQGTMQAWGAVAGCLAVITSSISAFAANRSLEMQEDAMRPYPCPSFDVESRHELVQLRVTNLGRSVAYSVRFKWDSPLKNTQDQALFSEGGHTPEIAVLLPGASVSALVGVSHKVFAAGTPDTYQGTVFYRDATGAEYSRRFLVSAAQHRHGLLYDREETRTHYELQQIPDKLDAIASAIERATKESERQ